MSRTLMTTCEISPITITLMREVGDWGLVKLQSDVKFESLTCWFQQGRLMGRPDMIDLSVEEQKPSNHRE